MDMKEMVIRKLKKLLPELEGFDCIHWGGLAEPLLNDIYEQQTCKKICS